MKCDKCGKELTVVSGTPDDVCDASGQTYCIAPHICEPDAAYQIGCKARDKIDADLSEFLEGARGLPDDPVPAIIARHVRAYRKPLEDAARKAIDELNHIIATPFTALGIRDDGTVNISAVRRSRDALKAALDGKDKGDG